MANNIWDNTDLFSTQEDVTDLSPDSPAEEEVQKAVAPEVPSVWDDPAIMDNIPKEVEVPKEPPKEVAEKADEHLTAWDIVVGAGETVLAGTGSSIGFLIGTVAGGIGGIAETAEMLVGNENADPLQTFIDVQSGVSQSTTFVPRTKGREAIEKKLNKYIVEPLDAAKAERGMSAEALATFSGATEKQAQAARSIEEAKTEIFPTMLGVLFPGIRGKVLTRKTAPAKAPPEQINPIPQSHETVAQQIKGAGDLSKSSPKEVADKIALNNKALDEVEDAISRTTDAQELTTLQLRKQELLNTKNEIEGALLSEHIKDFENFWEFSLDLPPPKVQTMLIPSGRDLPTLKRELFNVEMKLHSDGTPTNIFTAKPKWRDLGDTELALRGVQPPRILREINPLAQDGLDRVFQYNKNVDIITEKLLFGTEFLPGKKSFSALGRTNRAPTEKGGLTAFIELSQSKDPSPNPKLNLAEHTVDSFLKLEAKALAENRKVGQLDFDELNMTPRQIQSWNAIQGMMLAIKDKYNSTVKLNDLDVPLLPDVPAYLPRMFLGEYKVFSKENGQTVHVAGLRNKKEADAFVKQMQAENPNMTFDVARRGEFANIKDIDKLDKVDQASIAAKLFADVVFSSKDSPKARMVQAMYSKFMEKSVFSHAKERKGVSGFLGEDLNARDMTKAIELYTKGAVKYIEGLSLRRDLDNYYQDYHLKNAFPNTLEYIRRVEDNARGRKGTIDTFIDQHFGTGMSKKIERGAGLLGMGAALRGIFVFNPRFLGSQIIQPVHTWAGLVREKGRGNKASVIRAQIEGIKEFIAPTPETVAALRNAVRNGELQANFVNEILNFNKGDIFNSKAFQTATGIGIAGQIEAWSRTMSYLTSYRFMRNSGKSIKDAQANAEAMTRLFMVEYDNIYRPVLLSKTHGGAAASMVRTFKTFAANRLSQYESFIRTARHEKDFVPLVTTMAADAIVAGLVGTIAVKTIDAFIELVNSVLDTRMDTLSDMLITSGLSDWALLGAPSAATDIDFHGSLAAPELTSKSVLSSPGLEFGIDALQASVEYGKHVFRGTVTDDANYKYASKMFPSNILGLVEEYIYRPGEINPKTKRQNVSPVKGKPQAGLIRRDTVDRVARLLGTYSVKERRLLDQYWYLQKYTKSRQDKASILINAMSAHIVKYGTAIPVPQYMTDMLANETDFDMRKLSDTILNNIKNRNIELIEKENLRKSKSLSGKRTIQKFKDSTYLGVD